MLRKNCISEVTVERSTHKKCNNLHLNVKKQMCYAAVVTIMLTLLCREISEASIDYTKYFTILVSGEDWVMMNMKYFQNNLLLAKILGLQKEIVCFL